MEEFDKKGCGDPPSGALKWVDKPLPALTEEEISSGGVAKSVAVGAAATVILYGAYRVIRFLPSLFPPLWPSIPANLAIP